MGSGPGQGGWNFRCAEPGGGGIPSAPPEQQAKNVTIVTTKSSYYSYADNSFTLLRKTLHGAFKALCCITDWTVHSASRTVHRQMSGVGVRPRTLFLHRRSQGSVRRRPPTDRGWNFGPAGGWNFGPAYGQGGGISKTPACGWGWNY